MDHVGAFGVQPAAELANVEGHRGAFAADVPGDVPGALVRQGVHQPTAVRHDDGLVACRDQRTGDLQRALLDAAAFQRGQNLHDLQCERSLNNLAQL